MLKNIPGEAFIYEGRRFVVGEIIVATKESEYGGLFGEIMEIRDGEDKDTDNDTPDIICNFEKPELPYERKHFEDIFSGLYREQKKLDDIGLDYVIMAPDMIRPVCIGKNNRNSLKVYLVKEEWVENGEPGSLTEVFADEAEAKYHLNQSLLQERTNGHIARWLEDDNLTWESGMVFCECYLMGDYPANHYKIRLEETEVYLSKEHLEQL